MLDDAFEIAVAVTVAISEAERVELVENGLTPPWGLHGSILTFRLCYGYLVKDALDLGLNGVKGTVLRYEIARAVGIGEVTIGVGAENKLDWIAFLLLP